MDLGHLLFGFSGRINRAKFWLGMILSTIVLLALCWPLLRKGTGPSSIVVLVYTVFIYIASLWIGFALLIKRCHDRGKDGAWSLLSLIPIVGTIWAIIDLGLLEGEDGANKWGANPLASEPPHMGVVSRYR